MFVQCQYFLQFWDGFPQYSWWYCSKFDSISFLTVRITIHSLIFMEVTYAEQRFCDIVKAPDKYFMPAQQSGRWWQEAIHKPEINAAIHHRQDIDGEGRSIWLQSWKLSFCTSKDDAFPLPTPHRNLGCDLGRKRNSVINERKPNDFWKTLIPTFYLIVTDFDISRPTKLSIRTSNSFILLRSTFHDIESNAIPRTCNKHHVKLIFKIKCIFCHIVYSDICLIFISYHYFIILVTDIKCDSKKHLPIA